MQAAKSAKAASDIFELKYEMHSGAPQPARGNWAQGYYNTYASGAAATIGTAAANALSQTSGATIKGAHHKADGGRIPAYEQGTAYVPKTGLAVVHKGEKIIPAAQNTGYTPTIKVYIGDTELKDMVRVEVDDHNDAVTRAMTYGRR
jgi:hypothetical protein